MTESALYAEILAAHCHSQTRLWRTNAGMAWQGTVITRTPTTLVLAHPRPIKLAQEGMSDLIGWTSEHAVTDYNTPNERAKLNAVFVAIECKFGKRQTTEAQANFLELVRRMGGRSGVARSVEDAGKIIRGEL